MKTSSSKPTITPKWNIIVPTNTYDSVTTLYKVWFGKKYFIWKSKSLLQGCEMLAVMIDRWRRKGNIPDTDYLYYVVNHIKNARVLQATVEVVANEFNRKGSESIIDGFKLLKAEQELLNKAKNDYLCLNNNEIAYTPKWISVGDINKFEKYLSK
jgi:hypothetical protein